MAINDYKLSYSGAKIDELLTKVNNMPEDLSGLKYQIVTELPTENIDSSTIYLVETSSHDYNEWIYVNNTWEMLGNTAVDLTNYATKEYVDSIPHSVLVPFKTTYTTDEYIEYYNLLTDAYAEQFPIYLKLVGSNGTKDMFLPLMIKHDDAEANTQTFTFEYADMASGTTTVKLIFDNTNQTLTQSSEILYPAIKTINEDVEFVDGVDPQTILAEGCYKIQGKVFFNGVENTWFTNHRVQFVQVVAYTDVYFIYGVSTDYLRKNQYGSVYNSYNYSDNKWTAGEGSCWVTNLATQSYVNDRSFVTVVSGDVNFVDGENPGDKYGSGWYVFKGKVSFNGTENTWIDSRCLVQIRYYNDYYYMYIVDPDAIYRNNGRTGIYRYYKFADAKWYPAGGGSMYTTNALTKNNTEAYTPTSDYHPATKKYVDDIVSDAIMPATLSHYASDAANIAMLDACVILDMTSGAFGITRPALLQTEGYYFAYLSNVSIDTTNSKVMYTFTGLTDVVYGAVDSEVGTVEAIITRDMTAGTLTKAYSVKNIATKQYVDEQIAAAGSSEGKLDALGSITGIWGGSQTEYDALTTKDPKVLYFIQE